MRRTLGRTAATTVVVLFATASPPAQATTLNTVAFAGTMTLSGPMGIPCTPGTTPGGPKCDPGIATKNYPLPDPLPGNTKANPSGGNTRSHAETSSVCVDTTANVNKPGKAFTHVGTCSFSGSGTVSGWCGLNLGDGSGTFLDALGQAYSVTYNFNVVGTVMIVLGHTVKLANGQPGLLLLSGLAVPGPVGSTTCTAVAATQYTITLFGFIGSI